MPRKGIWKDCTLPGADLRDHKGNSHLSTSPKNLELKGDLSQGRNFTRTASSVSKDTLKSVQLCICCTFQILSIILYLGKIYQN